jgi:hypothetical protein
LSTHEAHPPVEVVDYDPSDYEKARADEGYIHYLGGIAMINDPFATEALHYLNPKNTRHLEPILEEADSWLWGGLRQVVLYAHPLEIREHSGKIMGKRFKEAKEHMESTVSRVLNGPAQRIEHIKPEIIAVRPQAMLNPKIYSHLCYPRQDKLNAERILRESGLFPSPLLREMSATDLRTVFREHRAA